MEAPHLLTCKREECSMGFGDDIEFLTHHKPSHPDTPLAVVVVDIAVNLVFVDALGEELANDEIDFRP